MISESGAALVATVYPIGLLIVTVNRRRLKPSPLQKGKRFRNVARVCIEVAHSIAVVGAVASVMICVVAVAAGIPIHNPWYTLVIATSGLVLGMSAMFILQALALDVAAHSMGLKPKDSHGGHPARSTRVRRARISGLARQHINRRQARN